VYLWLCTASVHNTKQNSSDNLPSYLQTNIIAEVMSIAGEGALACWEWGVCCCCCYSQQVRQSRWLTRCYLARLNELLPSVVHLMPLPRVSNGSVLLPLRYATALRVTSFLELWQFAGITGIECVITWPNGAYDDVVINCGIFSLISMCWIPSPMAVKLCSNKTLQFLIWAAG